MDVQVNGRSVHVYTGGKPLDPSLPAVVLLHGALHDHSVWTLPARWLAHHGWAVLAVDLPAHGRSAGPPLARVEDAAAWLQALLQAAGLQRAALVGHSMGSLMALEAAAQRPGLATHLVLVGTAWPMKVSPALLATAQQQPLAAIDMVNAFSLSTWAAKPAHPGPGSWLHGGNRALMRRTQAGWADGNLFAHDFAVCDAYAGGAAAAARVACPTTLVLGSRDQMTPPKAAAALREALPAAPVVLLPSGHALMQEVPEAFLQALRGALGG
jgi:pimeloyl-ACP methyl ester carboxylesterase